MAVFIFRKTQNQDQVKKILTCILFVSVSASAQNALQQMVAAEKAFAAFTEKHTVKEGFLLYMDSAGVLFRNGKAVRAIDVFAKQPATAGVLNWKPDFAVMGSSGDMGISSGPYSFRQTMNDTVVSAGHFSSVWIRKGNGEWKNRVDLGVNYDKNIPQNQESFFETLSADNTSGTMVADFFPAEQAFIEAVSAGDRKKIITMLTDHSRWLLDQFAPFDGKSSIEKALQQLPANIQFRENTRLRSAAGDLVCIYGSAVSGDKISAYIHVWGLQADGWKLLLQTIK